MADYWKSQPKKFCQYCKCWIADNKPSVEFHERGKNHKENVAAKITEIKQKSLDKVKQEARMSKDFATMEEAALKAYEEDIKRIAMESGSQAQMTTTTTSTTTTSTTKTSTTKTAAKTAAKTKTVTVLAKPPPHQQEKGRKGARAKKRKQAQAEQEAWVEGRTEDGHTYFYNLVTGESKWDRPEGFQGDSNTAQLGHSESSSDGAWMEAASPEGYMYYYNKETGESSWVRPAHLPPREMEWQPKPPGTQQTAHDDGKESSEAEQAPAEAESNGQVSQQPIDPQSSVEQRKAETDPTEKEGDKGAVAVVVVDDQKRDVGEQKEDAGEEKPAEEVQKPPPVAEPERKPKIVIQVRKTRMANAYGAWEKIKQEVDPYASVDLQLPQVDTASMAEALPPAPKPKFRERTITSLGQEGGPASFKKSKMQNGKSRSLRQRGKDE